MLFALLCCTLAFGGDTLQEENDALREAIEGFQEESGHLRAEVTELHATIELKDTTIDYQLISLEAMKAVVEAGEKQNDLLRLQLESSEALGAEYERLYREELQRKPKPIERVLWATGIALVGGGLAFSAVHDALD